MSHDAHGHHPQSFLSKYVFSFDHKVIGIQYIAMAVVMAVVAGYLALVIRFQLANPKSELVPPETYLSLVTMHGTIMVFFVVSLTLVSGFGNFLIPLQIGARDMAYPFLNMLSFWVMVPACLLMLVSFFVEGGAAAAGWTSYPPLSALPDAIPGSGLGQTLWILAMALFIASFTMGGLNYLTTILNNRAKGMTMMRMPLVIWMFLIAAILGLLAFPPLTAAAIMLLLDRHAGTSFYLPAGMIINGHIMPNQGGTPLLFQHLFWFLGHPEVYVLVLPALGIGFELLAAFGRRAPFGYKPTVYSTLLIGFLSMIVWGHHMFVSGMDPRVGKYFSIATVIITAPFGVLGVNLLLTLWKARIQFTTPMLFALALVSTVGAGGLGGLYLGTSTSDVYFHETYFVVGHFHLMIGTVTFLGTFGGIYFWFPKMFGKMMDDKLGKIHFWLTFPPMISIFILMHMQGLGGMLRRTYDVTVYQYNQGNTSLLWPITILATILVAAQAIFLLNVVKSLMSGKRAEANPWGASTLEWTHAASPAPHGNWGEHEPVLTTSCYEFDGPATAPTGTSAPAMGGVR